MPRAWFLHKRWMSAGVVLLGVLMSTLDFSIVNISLPVMAHAFRVPMGGAVEWIVIAYSLTVAAALITVGRLADVLGHKRIWMAGLLLFTGSSLLCSLAPLLGLLIAARAVQGLGYACLAAVSPVLFTASFPTHARGRALGTYAVVVGVGTSAGPTVGGLLMTWGSWHWIFLVNVPIGIISLLLSLRLLASQNVHPSHAIDLPGALLLALGMAGLVAGCSLGQTLGWTTGPILGSLSIGLFAFALLPLIEKHQAHPILVQFLWQNRRFVAALISSFLNFVALIAVGFLLPFYLEDLRRFSVLHAAFLLTPVPIAIALCSPVCGALADRWGTRWLASAGLGIASLGLVGIACLQTSTAPWAVIACLTLAGVGRALFQAPNTSAALGAAPTDHQGSASALLATARELGSSVSIALAGALFASTGGAGAANVLALHLHHVPAAPFQQAFLTSFHLVFLVCAVLATLGALVSLSRGQE